MTQLQITGMTCDSWAAHVKQAPDKVHGVRSARVPWATGNAQLAMSGDTPLAALTSALTALGYRATLSDARLAPKSESTVDKALAQGIEAATRLLTLDSVPRALANFDTRGLINRRRRWRSAIAWA